MKRKIVLRITLITGIIVIILGTCYYLHSNTLYFLRHGELISESVSPFGTYTVNIYTISAALSADTIRGEVINNSTGRKKNIYYGYSRYLFEDGIGMADVLWETDEIVIINRQKLNVTTDIYDFRRD